MTVKLVDSHGHALALEGGEPAGYGLGRAGWVNVPLRTEGVSLDLLRDFIEESYRIIAPKLLVAELDRRVKRGGRARGRARGRGRPWTRAAARPVADT
jgi:predicted DNA-binding protein (MmcQ/YjbR family)